MSAPLCFMTSCGAMTLPSDFDILRPSSSRTKPCVKTASYGARPRVPHDSISEELNQPRCWSEPSRYSEAGHLSSGRCSRTKAWLDPESKQARVRAVYV